MKQGTTTIHRKGVVPVDEEQEISFEMHGETLLIKVRRGENGDLLLEYKADKHVPPLIQAQKN